MKLEKFRNVSKKNIINIIVIIIIVLMAGIIIYQSYALYEEKKSFNVLNGTVPLFGSTTGTVELAYTIDGQAKTDPFPTKESKYIAKNVTCENGVEANWNNIEWALVVKNSNNKEKVKCTIDFTKKKIEVYGIEREFASTSSAWTRTNDAVGKIANAQIGESAVRNDFDYIYPWSEIKSYNYNISTKKITAWIEDRSFKYDGSNGEVLTYIPEFYYQRYQDGTKEYIEISKEYIEGFTKSEAFSVGRYLMSGSANNVHSVSGELPLVNTNITDFRTYARNLGSGFGQMDYHYFIIQMLYLVEYADYNIQSKIGLGYVNSTLNAPITSGGCDILNMHSGSVDGTDKTSIIYRGIEDIYGNIWQFIDGINIKNYQAYVCYDQSKYEVDKFDGCYQKIGYLNADVSGFISKIGYDTNNSIISFPIEVLGSENTYITDYFWNSMGNRIVLVGGRYGHGTNDGLWDYNNSHFSSDIGNLYSSRLIKTN